MLQRSACFLFLFAVLLFRALPAGAYEIGYPGAQVFTGIGLGNTTAAAPPPGIYMFDQVATYQAKIVGPGAPNVGGQATTVNVNSGAVGFLWAPGWTFLGATYDAVLVQPFANADVGSPANSFKKGMHNTFIIPVELSWKFGDSGLFFKTGLGVGVPDGSIMGANGLGSIGNPWWTFRPEALLSYLKDGWGLTAGVFAEFNTRNTITNYRTGTILEVDLKATKTINRFTFGPVGYYLGQISDDSSSAFYNYATNLNRYNVWAAGGLIGYDFGPAQLNFWAVDEFRVNASGGSPFAGGPDRASQGQGFRAFLNVSYRIWGPDSQDNSTKPLVRK
jgi:hypothetical protein